jgi:hypothetical protein
VKLVGGVAWFLLLCVRGLALWLVVPLSVVGWLLLHWWAQRATIKQAMCWYDQNLWALLILVPFRVLMRVDAGLRSLRLLRLSEMRTLETYRIWLDTGSF